MAELFTGSLETDALFTAKLGLNTLIREAMHAGSVKDLSTLVHQNVPSPKSQTVKNLLTLFFVLFSFLSFALHLFLLLWNSLHSLPSFNLSV